MMKTRNKILIMVIGICLTVLLSTSCSPATAVVGVAATVNPDGAAAAVVKPVKKEAVGTVKAVAKPISDGL